MTESMREFLDQIIERLTPPASAQARQLAHEARQKMADLYVESQTEVVPGPFESGSVTQAWLDDVLTRRAERSRREEVRQVLVSFIKEAEDRAKSLSPNSDDLLRAYDQKLKELLAEVAPLAATLAGLTSAEKAIAAGKSAEWGRVADLAVDYQLLRDAQMSRYTVDLVISSQPVLGGEPTASDLCLSNLDDLWPSWRNPGMTPGQTIYPNTPGRIDRREPWPPDPVPLLLWLVTSDAKPWIPTPAQLGKLRAERAASGNPNPRPVVKPANFNGPKLAPQYPVMKTITSST